MRNSLLSFLFALLSLCAFSQDLDSLLNPVKYRNIGPFRGGRSVSSCGVIGDPMTYYMGTTGGGLWKTQDAGQSWKNISDGFFQTGSVGAVAVAPNDPNIVYCGMGEHAPRAVMTSYGDGVYKSTDAGKTWQSVGLEKTQHISRIIIHPKNPDIVYVAAQGALYDGNPERGIYKSTDGGQSWKQVLFVNELTGCSELSMDQNNPLIMYAGMWEHQRLPWKVISGGKGSGVYKSSDGGETWKAINKGLPADKGKIAVSVCQSNPDRVYALVEGDTEKDLGGLFVTNNGGGSWSKVSGDNRLTQRAWYYIEVFADPNDENTLYVLSAPALKSIDGGKTWSGIYGTHGDYHDLWINPDNSKNMVISNDGGAAISFNGGKSWSTQSNMPTAQIYKVNADNLFPYNLYGGQQDNSSLRIASLAMGTGAITKQHWSASAGGESAYLAFDPDNPRYVMGGSYLGTMELLDTESKGSVQVMAAPIQYLGSDAKDMRYRYNWCAPIIYSQHEENTFYQAAQYVMKSTDKGQTWQVISPDLSKNEIEKQGKGGGPLTNEAVGAENYGTVSYLMESPHEQGVIWACTDDGLVQLTKNGGDSWENVTPKGLEECLVNAIDVSPHDPATAYVATTRFKFNDYAPGLYKTTDYGKTWKSINKGIPTGAFTRVVREDSERADLLFAGTELGMYISYNGGADWTSFQLNLPVVPINDLKVHQGDLLVATAGRSFWILDDLGLIRQFEPTSQEVNLYQPEDAVIGHWYSGMNSNSASGKSTFSGVNPASGVVFYYQLNKVSDTTSVELLIKDQNGEVVNRYGQKGDPTFRPYAGGPSPKQKISVQAGLNRFVWNMAYPTMKGVPNCYIEAGYSGHQAIPGDYTAELIVDGQSHSTSFTILENPVYEASMEDYQAHHELMLEMENELNAMHTMVNTIFDLKGQIKALSSQLDSLPELKQEAENLVKKMTAWDEEMVQRKTKAYDDVENFPNKFTANYMFLINQTDNVIPQINAANLERLEELNTLWDGYQKEGNEILTTDVPELNAKLWEAGIGALRKK